MRKSLCKLFVLSYATLTLIAKADDLFVISGTADGHAILPVSDNQVLNLVRDAIKAQGIFIGLQNANDIHLALRYGGVDNAITVHLIDDHVLTLKTIAGFNKTFVGFNRSDLEHQVEDFLKKNQQDVLADLYKKINATSPVAIADGNPNAATARMAARAYDQFATFFPMTVEERESFRECRGHFSVTVAPDFAAVDNHHFSGWTASLPIDFHLKITDRVAFQAELMPTYADMEGAKFYEMGSMVGLPIKLIKNDQASPWSWTVTPSASADIVGSPDFVAGGLIMGGSLSSVLGYDFPGFTLSMGNQISFFEDGSLNIDGYNFASGVSQQILKNGLQASVPFARRWVVQASGSYSRFLSRAAIRDYYTVGGKIAYRLLGDTVAPDVGRGYLFLSAYVDIASDYTSPHIALGSGWKF